MEDITVAIEISSSKIAGAAGIRHSDDTLDVLAYVSEPASELVRKGVVYNIDKTAQCLTNIVNCLYGALGGNVNIDRAYIGCSGVTLHSSLNKVVSTFDADTRITKELIDSMEDKNNAIAYADMDCLKVIPQEYRIGNNLQVSPIGINCTEIEANYLNILARSVVMDHVGKALNGACIESVDDYILPLLNAEAVLTDTEIRQGCALVDMGADTTTVSIYKNSLLRSLVVLPLGAHNIIRDLCSLQLEEDEAEQLLHTYGLIVPADADDAVQFDGGRTISLVSVHDCIEARFEEIIANVQHQIEASGYADKLLAGIVFCGGCINLQELEKSLTQRTFFAKHRLAFEPVGTIHWQTPEQPCPGTQGPLVAMLMSRGEYDKPCCSYTHDLTNKNAEELSHATQGKLFTDDGESEQAKRDQERQQRLAEKKERENKKKAKSQGYKAAFNRIKNGFERQITTFLKDEE